MTQVELRGIMVCVEYGDLLNVTLPYNRHHFKELLVVTTSWDAETIQVAKRNDAGLFYTDSFYKDGATFNKWRALEEGLDAFGRTGWLCIMDADVLWPKSVDLSFLSMGTLCTPRRRIMTAIDGGWAAYPPEKSWQRYPLFNEVEFAGYSQIFHADDPHLPAAPWHQTNWRHAGGGDSFFQARWPVVHKVRPPWQVLHLGSPGVNWHGRCTTRVDGTVPPQAAHRAALHHATLASRRGRTRQPGADPYATEKLPPSP